MKILHVCESVIGGTGSYLSEVIPHQVARYGRGNVVLLVPTDQYKKSDRALIDSGAEVLVFSRPSRLSGTMFLVRAYLKALFSVAPDVVHAHSSIAGLIVRVLRMPRGPKIVYCPHGWSVDKTDSARVRVIAEVVERLLALLPDKVIAISEYEYRRGLGLGFDAERLRLVTNGIDARVPPGEAAVWDDQRVRVLYVGRFDRQKGVDLLLDAVAEHGASLAVRLIGDFAVDSPGSARPIPTWIERLGWLDRQSVAAHMKSCDVLVVPSRWEGFGLVAIEAMRVGVPVLATDVGGLTEIVGGGQCGYLVPPENPGAIRDTLLRLTKDGLRQMGARAQQHFREAYTSERVVKQLDDLYAEVVAVGAAREAESQANAG